MKRAASVCAWVSFGFALLAPRIASAYCRTHACNPADPAQNCAIDAQHCVTTGLPLAWPSACVSFSVQEDGSKKYGITADAFGSMLTAAFAQWVTTSCLDGSAPSLSIENIGVAACDQVEFNTSAANANVWMFRDDVWPYEGGEDALGLSTVHYDPDTGDIQDVDVEINSAGPKLSIGDPVDPDGADLQSIVTHEAGHFLGLSHTLIGGSTMLGGYTLGDSSQRVIGPDDSDGICAAYLAGRATSTADCSPRRGFSTVCGGALPTTTTTTTDDSSSAATKGCAMSSGAAPGKLPVLALPALAGLLLLRRRARVRASRSSA
ncbi:MAG TPA: matrixin family metalloprotease [Polyangiaceae bacterium]|jgi:MYXO-CTERM domain-containing protein|nr:matrixin family metalloprotease [Polyangiaceae bacterium]